MNIVRIRTLTLACLAVSALASPARGQGLAKSATATLEQLQEVEARIHRVTHLYEAAQGEDRVVFLDQLARQWTEHHQILSALATDLARDLEAGKADSSALATVKSSLADEISFLKRRAGIWDESIASLLIERSKAPRESWFELEGQVADANARLDRILTGLAQDYESAANLRMDVAAARAAFDSLLSDRAALLAARLESVREELSRLEVRVSRPGAPKEALEAEIGAAKERIRGTSASLETVSGLMEPRGLSTARYRALLLEVTGEMGKNIFDPDVARTLVRKWSAGGVYWLKTRGPKILVRTLLVGVIVLASSLLARVIGALVGRGVRSSRLPTSMLLHRLVAETAAKLVWVIGFLAVLAVVGIHVGPMLAGLGIAGFIAGFALQDTLSNFAADLMIMIYRPFDVGDVVTVAGVTGTVGGLTVVSTLITTPDNQRIVVPNSKVWGNTIHNVTVESLRRVDLVFGISYQDNIDKAREILENIVRAHALVLADPEPVVRLHTLGESSVDFVCRPWCKTEDYWTVYWDVTREVKKRFDAEGVSIPIPQREVYLHDRSG